MDPLSSFYDASGLALVVLWLLMGATVAVWAIAFVKVRQLARTGRAERAFETELDRVHTVGEAEALCARHPAAPGAHVLVRLLGRQGPPALLEAVVDSGMVAEREGMTRLRSIVFPQNRGRSAALNAGFDAAAWPVGKGKLGWGTTGLAYNVDKIKERMPDAPLDSWRMLFDPAIASKFADCGIMVLDAADDVLPSALEFIGENPDSKDPKVLEKGAEVVQKVRPSIRKFHSSENINSLANGDICLSLMFSGDAGIAATRAEEAKNGVDIAYVIPQEGAQLWFDMMAIPADAPNVENAYAFINYLLEPEVMAKISNFVTYPNAVPASLPLIDEEVKGDPNLFPPADLRQKLFVVTPYDQKVQRAVTRLWTRVVTGS